MMLINKLIDAARRYFFGAPEEQEVPVVHTEPPAPEVVPTYALPEVWPFPGRRPTNEAVHALNKGLTTQGDHIRYVEASTGRVRNSVALGGQQWSVKMMVYWLWDQELDTSRVPNAVGVTCDNKACARPDHLVVRYVKLNVPKDNPPQPQKRPSRSGPPEVKLPKGSTYAKQDEELLSGDRTRCVSAKVYFESETRVKKAATMFNTTMRKPGGRKLYGYQCDWCGGHHLTKQNPKTRPKYVHKGSWS